MGLRPPSMMTKRKPRVFLSSSLSSSYGCLGFLNHPSIRALYAHRSIRYRLLNLPLNATLADPLRGSLGSRWLLHTQDVVPFFLEHSINDCQKSARYRDLGYVWPLPSG